MEEIVNWLPVIINLVIASITTFVLLKKAGPEIAKIRAEKGSDDADAVESYANATRLYSQELIAVRKELESLRAEMDRKDQALQENARIIIEQKTVIEDLKDWGERLSHQVRSLAGIPVPLRITKKVSKETNKETLKDIDGGFK